MIRSEFIFSGALYCAVSLLIITVEFLIASFFVRGLFIVCKFICGIHSVYKIKFMIYDFAGFALLVVLNAVTQYYISALLAFNTENKKHRYLTILASTLITAFFFVHLSSKTGFAFHIMAAIPLIASYLIGGLFGINEDRNSNPWKNSNIRIFQ